MTDEEKLDESLTNIWNLDYDTAIRRKAKGTRKQVSRWHCGVVHTGNQTPENKLNSNTSSDDEPAPDNVPNESTSIIGSAYRKRSTPRVIRYRSYELDDDVNYKREIVTLYLPFKNEVVEILNRNGFLGVYDEREVEIMFKCKEFESYIDI